MKPNMVVRTPEALMHGPDDGHPVTMRERMAFADLVPIKQEFVVASIFGRRTIVQAAVDVGIPKSKAWQVARRWADEPAVRAARAEIMAMTLLDKDTVRVGLQELIQTDISKYADLLEGRVGIEQFAKAHPDLSLGFIEGVKTKFGKDGKPISREYKLTSILSAIREWNRMNQSWQGIQAGEVGGGVAQLGDGQQVEVWLARIRASSPNGKLPNLTLPLPPGIPQPAMLEGELVET